MKITRTIAAVLALAAASAPALAGTFTMTFDGIDKVNTAAEKFEGVAEILGYYNGDPGPVPAVPRPDSPSLGVTFAPGALAINSEAALGPGTFPTAHSGSSAAGSITGAPVRFDLSTGLSLSALEFWYDTLLVEVAPTVQLFSDGVSVFSGRLAVCAVLPTPPPEPNGFCGWTQYVLAESEWAKLAAKGIRVTAVEFQSSENSAVFDDVSLSTTTQDQPIPEPSSIALAVLGLALSAGIARRRRVA